jgi:hypothetical protein
VPVNGGQDVELGRPPGRAHCGQHRILTLSSTGQHRHNCSVRSRPNSQRRASSAYTAPVGAPCRRHVSLEALVPLSAPLGRGAIPTRRVPRPLPRRPRPRSRNTPGLRFSEPTSAGARLPSSGSSRPSCHRVGCELNGLPYECRTRGSKAEMPSPSVVTGRLASRTRPSRCGTSFLVVPGHSRGSLLVRLRSESARLVRMTVDRPPAAGLVAVEVAARRLRP